MAWKISLNIETGKPERRDAIMEAIVEALQEHSEGPDKATMKVEREGLTGRGKRKIVDTIEWMPAYEDPPVIADFGLVEERPLERALRDLKGTELSANGKTVKIA